MLRAPTTRMRNIAILFFTLVALLISRAPLSAAEPTTVLVQLDAAVDPHQFSRDHQATLVASVEALSIYRLQSAASDWPHTLASDPRVVHMEAEQSLATFESQQRPYSEAAGDADALKRYFGSGSGDGEDDYAYDHEDEKCEKEVNKMVEEVLIVEDGAEFDEKWTHWGLKKAKFDKAHKEATGRGAIVAVLDTGVDLDHPLLVDQLLPGYDFVERDEWPDDAPNGQDEDADTLFDEATGHGTHVAGVIAEVAPNSQILPVRVLNSDGGGAMFDIIEALVYAVDRGAHVINLSMSVMEHSPHFEAAIRYALDHDVVVVAAAAGGVNGLTYPAGYADVLAVGSVNLCDYATEFSKPIADLVDVFAPGELIYSAYFNGNYAWWSGTSMAAPFVSGEAALLAERQACSAACMRQLIIGEVDKIKTETPHKRGRLQAEKAVKEAEPKKGECSVDDPISLVFEYTGASCLATTNDQDGKVKCSGDPAGAQAIQFVLTKDEEKMMVSPADQAINVGTHFTVWSAEDKELKSKIKGEIRQNGLPLQTLEIETSCGKPLNIGDQFGSLVLREFVAESSTPISTSPTTVSAASVSSISLVESSDPQVTHTVFLPWAARR